MPTTLNLSINITVTPTSDDRYDVRCPEHPDFDRPDQALKDLRGAVSSIFGEVGSRIANQQFPLHP